MRPSGLTPADLGFRTRAAKGTAGPKREAGTKTRAGKIKFRDDQGHSWAGHGRRPQWFLDALAGGKTERDLAV